MMDKHPGERHSGRGDHKGDSRLRQRRRCVHRGQLSARFKRRLKKLEMLENKKYDLLDIIY